jgi:hypothetical protein
MKKIGFQISILMAFVISLCLSFVGTFCSGQFRLPSFLMSFGISFFISLLIGFLIPMKKVHGGMEQKFGLEPGSMKARLAEAAVSDLIYTPVMTLAMTLAAYKNAVAHGAKMPYLPMFLKSLLISLAAAFCIIYLVTPVIFRFVMKQNGVGEPPHGTPPQG